MSYSKSKKATLISIVAIIIALTSLFGVLIGSSNKSDSNGVTYFGYSVGTIDSTTGKALDSKLSIYTPDKYNVEGLEIKLADEPTVTYKVFFYDEDGEFISASAEQSGDFDATNIPSNADTFRVLIIPNKVDGKDVEVTIKNKSSYVKQLNISFDK